MPSFIITGARTGIGLEYVRQLALHPDNTIIALVRNATSDMASLDRIISDAQALVILVECDLSSSESITSLPARLPQDLGYDIVIQNAAILLSGSYEESTLNVTPDSLRAHFETNVIGPALLFQTLAPFLNHGAVVANITSGVGSMKMLSRGQITAQIPAYSLSKAALNMLTVHQAEQLKGKAIVVCVDPGHVKTQMGGPGAVMEVEDSAKNVVATLGRLRQEDSGKFLLYNGTELPW
ncbi:hypothetical protein F5X68DRAFT_262475 [Plectosphaerella plurivora]|uniref:C-factor n=1 Tax=Plectosphaerella plurivora TaxID=936078 RepID=A0A9P8VBL0_9PEZI|nr:hypothetical protein F5X68DRAFT_262475 [Plectosphaerella plurivora]